MPVLAQVVVVDTPTIISSLGSSLPSTGAPGAQASLHSEQQAALASDDIAASSPARSPAGAACTRQIGQLLAEQVRPGHPCLAFLLMHCSSTDGHAWSSSATPGLHDGVPLCRCLRWNARTWWCSTSATCWLLATIWRRQRRPSQHSIRAQGVFTPATAMSSCRMCWQQAGARPPPVSLAQCRPPVLRAARGHRSPALHLHLPHSSNSRFDLAVCEQGPLWAASLLGVTSPSPGAVPSEADAYGIASCSFSARRPFHPQRLWDAVHGRHPSMLHCAPQHAPLSLMEHHLPPLLRSKGFFWVAGMPEVSGLHASALATSQQIAPVTPGASCCARSCAGSGVHLARDLAPFVQPDGGWRPWCRVISGHSWHAAAPTGMMCGATACSVWHLLATPAWCQIKCCQCWRRACSQTRRWRLARRRGQHGMIHGCSCWNVWTKCSALNLLSSHGELCIQRGRLVHHT